MTVDVASSNFIVEFKQVSTYAHSKLLRIPDYSNAFNAFYTIAPFLCLLKTSENQGFSDVFMGYRNGTLARNGLKISYLMLSAIWYFL